MIFMRIFIFIYFFIYECIYEIKKHNSSVINDVIRKEIVKHEQKRNNIHEEEIY